MASASRYLPNARRLPSSTWTCETMSAARWVTSTSWALSSAAVAGSSVVPDAVAAAVAAASFSPAAVRRVSCRSASVFAWAMRRSISPSSVSRRASSSAIRAERAGRVSGVVAGATVSVIVRVVRLRGGWTGSVFRHPDPALAHGIDHGLGPVVDGQLAEDRAHVVLDGLLADRQRVGDLLVGHALSDVVEDLDLARRERREDRGGVLAVDRKLAELLQDPGRDGWLGEDLVVDEVLAADHPPDDRDEVVRADVLEDERRGARLDRVEQRVLVLRLGEHDDPARRQFALDP